MSTTYRVKLSDGTRYQKVAQSAGEAIYAALLRHPGQTVVECHSGLTEGEAEALRATGEKAMAGAIFHDVPPHKPIDEPEIVE